MDEHLGYEKNSVAGNNSGNSRNGYGKKTIISDYGECEIAVPRDRNGDFEPKVIESDRQEPTRSNRKSCRYCTPAEQVQLRNVSA